METKEFKGLWFNAETDPEVMGNEVYQDGEIYGRCKNENSAKKLSDFMNGKRMSK